MMTASVPTWTFIFVVVAGFMWFGYLTVWGITRTILQRTYTVQPRAPHTPLPPWPVIGDDCTTHGCDRYASFMWHSVDLNLRLKVCGRCVQELVGLRGGFYETIRP